jgi:putative spermidine/putrescine transport system permease protein
MRRLTSSRLRDALGSAAKAVFLFLLFLFLLAPLLVVAGASLSGGARPYVSFPPEDISFEWYGRIPERFLETLGNSLLLACAAAVVSVLLAVPAALALVRGRFAGRRLVALLLRAPLQIPFVVVGIAFLQLYYFVGGLTGINLRGQLFGLLLGHVFLATPYAIGTVSATLQRFNVRLEEAARSLGATPWRAFWRVTLPVIMPGVYAGCLYAFIVSFGEVPVALFLGGPSMTTFPVEMFSSMQFDFNPSLLAVSTLILFFSLAVIVLFQKAIGLDALRRTSAGRQ